jgi:hypothetical protein
MAPQVEVVIVVGSPNSSNSNRLREVAEKKGTPAYMVDNASQIDPEWLDGKLRVGVTAGASAPGAGAGRDRPPQGTRRAQRAPLEAWKKTSPSRCRRAWTARKNCTSRGRRLICIQSVRNIIQRLSPYSTISFWNSGYHLPRSKKLPFRLN